MVIPPAEVTDVLSVIKGVIDPTKAVRCVLENAASVATLLLTGDSLIAEKSKEQLKGHGRDAEMYYCRRDHGKCPGKDKSLCP